MRVTSKACATSETAGHSATSRAETAHRVATHEDAGVRLVVIRRVQAVEALLAGRVPEVCGLRALSTTPQRRRRRERGRGKTGGPAGGAPTDTFRPSTSASYGNSVSAYVESCCGWLQAIEGTGGGSESHRAAEISAAGREESAQRAREACKRDRKRTSRPSGSAPPASTCRPRSRRAG